MSEDAFKIAHKQSAEKLEPMKKIIFKRTLDEIKFFKKIGIIGTRRRDSSQDYSLVEKKFFEHFSAGDWIVSGGCPKGGDRFAELIAKKYGIPILIFYPNYEKYGRYNAPKQRNTDIASWSDILIACVSDNREGGTEDTIKKFIEQASEKLVYLV